MKQRNIITLLISFALLLILSGCTSAPLETPSGGTGLSQDIVDTASPYITDAHPAITDTDEADVPETADTALPESAGKPHYAYISSEGKYTEAADKDEFDANVDRDAEIVAVIWLVEDGRFPSMITQSFADSFGLTDSEDYELYIGVHAPIITLSFDNYEAYAPYSDIIIAIAEHEGAGAVYVEPNLANENTDV